MLKCSDFKVEMLTCSDFKVEMLQGWGKEGGVGARAKNFRYFGVVSVSVQCRDWNIF